MNILTEKEVQEMLKIDERKARALMKSKAFPVIKIGREYRISEDNFMEWLNGGDCRIDNLRY